MEYILFGSNICFITARCEHFWNTFANDRIRFSKSASGIYYPISTIVIYSCNVGYIQSGHRLIGFCQSNGTWIINGWEPIGCTLSSGNRNEQLLLISANKLIHGVILKLYSKKNITNKLILSFILKYFFLK